MSWWCSSTVKTYTKLVQNHTRLGSHSFQWIGYRDWTQISTPHSLIIIKPTNIYPCGHAIVPPLPDQTPSRPCFEPKTPWGWRKPCWPESRQSFVQRPSRAEDRPQPPRWPWRFPSSPAEPEWRRERSITEMKRSAEWRSWVFFQGPCFFKRLQTSIVNGASLRKSQRCCHISIPAPPSPPNDREPLL